MDVLLHMDTHWKNFMKHDIIFFKKKLKQTKVASWPAIPLSTYKKKNHISSQHVDHVDLTVSSADSAARFLSRVSQPFWSFEGLARIMASRASGARARHVPKPIIGCSCCRTKSNSWRGENVWWRGGKWVHASREYIFLPIKSSRCHTYNALEETDKEHDEESVLFYGNLWGKDWH